MTPAYAYLRVSGPSQVDGDGFPRQLQTIRDYCQALGYSVAGVYREEAIPGASDLQSRPAMLEMLEHAKQHRVGVVIIEKLDRLARDLMIQEALFGEFKRREIKLISALEPDLQGSDPTRKFIRQVLGAVAELDKTLLVNRMFGARERIRATGKRCEGQKRYGERDGEAEPLAYMLEAQAAGKNAKAIAKELDQRWKSKRGKQWYPMVVARILRAHA